MKKDEHEAVKFGIQVLRASREDARLTIAQMAEAINTSTVTIWKWESGKSVPDILSLVTWFQALNCSPMPYIFQWLYPDRYAESDRSEVAALLSGVSSLDRIDRQRLLYAVTGNHGSYFPGVLQLMMAYLHLPLYTRIGSAALVELQYQQCEARGTLLHTDRPMPNMDLYNRCLLAGLEASNNGEEAYSPAKEATNGQET